MKKVSAARLSGRAAGARLALRWAMLAWCCAFWATECCGADLRFLALPAVTVNGSPASLFVGTDLPFTVLLDTGAGRLGMKNQGSWTDTEAGAVRVSESVPIKQAGQTITAPLLLVHIPLWAKPLLHLLPFRLDGLVGWPEIRDNILIFDSATRTIRRAEQLPPETAGWVKLKVEPADHLLLDLPLTNGETGVVSVNIGLELSPGAVTLSEVPWKEWKSSHPHGESADEVTMGPLTLTGVPVKKMAAAAADDLLYESPAAAGAWQIGSQALERMDLVVDSRNGWAYAHPKPPARVTNSPAPGDPWRVAENVRLYGDNLLVYSAWIKWLNQDFAGARADCERALALNPRNADAWSAEGTAREALGDFSGAVSNYDRAIALWPDHSEWERLYRQTLLWRLDSSKAERAQPPANAVAAPGSPVILDTVVVSAVQRGGNGRWARTVHLFLDGSMDEKTFLTAAKRSDGSKKAAAQKAQADYYIGMARLRKGDRDGAREWFQKCRSAGIKDDDEYFFAVAELERLAHATRHGLTF